MTREPETVVIATELPDNTGTLITNAAEHVATLVVWEHALEPHRLLWIEHYLPREQLEEMFERVTFAWDGKRIHTPQWQWLRREDVAQLTGGSR